MSAFVRAYTPAPALQVSQWLNTADPIALSMQHGRVVMLHAFQMLCPGCVSHGLPQAERVHRAFSRDGLRVVGLHTVFEHHAVMGAEALRAFNHEYRWSFPIGIDQAAPGEAIPLTMRAYGLEGTPSLVLIDRQGNLRLRHFGAIDDLVLGGVIGRLLAEAPASADTALRTDPAASQAERLDRLDRLDRSGRSGRADRQVPAQPERSHSAGDDSLTNAAASCDGDRCAVGRPS